MSTTGVVRQREDVLDADVPIGVHDRALSEPEVGGPHARTRTPSPRPGCTPARSRAARRLCPSPASMSTRRESPSPCSGLTTRCVTRFSSGSMTMSASSPYDPVGAADAIADLEAHLSVSSPRRQVERSLWARASEVGQVTGRVDRTSRGYASPYVPRRRSSRLRASSESRTAHPAQAVRATAVRRLSALGTDTKGRVGEENDGRRRRDGSDGAGNGCRLGGGAGRRGAGGDGRSARTHADHAALRPEGGTPHGRRAATLPRNGRRHRAHGPTMDRPARSSAGVPSALPLSDEGPRRVRRRSSTPSRRCCTRRRT